MKENSSLEQWNSVHFIYKVERESSNVTFHCKSGGCFRTIVIKGLHPGSVPSYYPPPTPFTKRNTEVEVKEKSESHQYHQHDGKHSLGVKERALLFLYNPTENNNGITITFISPAASLFITLLDLMITSPGSSLAVIIPLDYYYVAVVLVFLLIEKVASDFIRKVVAVLAVVVVGSSSFSLLTQPNHESKSVSGERNVKAVVAVFEVQIVLFSSSSSLLRVLTQGENEGGM